ncbi:MAG: sigma-70 family RNA polymerase sigma factor [Austwickia sp.]|nr:sigma-70 family RNA polymerase sigma factor [Austwickia sp.]
MTTDDDRDRVCFEALVEQTQQALRRYAVRRLPPDDVDDLVAEVYATAWRRRDAIPDPPLPWLYRTAAHHLAHARRAEARRTRLAARLTGSGEHGWVAPVEIAEADPDLAAVLAALPAADAEILRLAAWEELSPTEIAYVQGGTAGAARVRLHRARRRAAALLAAADSATTTTSTATSHRPPTARATAAPSPAQELSC